MPVSQIVITIVHFLKASFILNAMKYKYNYFVSKRYLKKISVILIRLISPAPTIKGIFCVIDACATQKPLPATDIISIYIEISSVCRVFKALIICGTRIRVQSNEAIQPSKTSVDTIFPLIRYGR